MTTTFRGKNQKIAANLTKFVRFILVVLLSFVIYYNTLTTDIGWSDSAELALQAFQLGVTHPPGYPVHTILGNLLNNFSGEPVYATTLLSAICTSLTTGLLNLTILGLTNNLIAAALLPFLYAFFPNIWENAVITEIYGVNMLFLAASIYGIILWKIREKNHYLLISACFFGISSGTSLGNVMLLPAFALFIILQEGNKLHNLAKFFTIILAFAIPMLLFSIVRSFSHPPLGTQYLPTSFSGAIKYFSGYQYGTTSIQEIAFYGTRTIQHAQLILKNLLYIGLVLAAWGLYIQVRKGYDTALFMLLMFAANLIYFTYYPFRDYTVMVAPAYYILTIWIAYSVEYLYRKAKESEYAFYRMSVIVCTAVFIFYPLQSQYGERAAHKERDRAERFTIEAFDSFPEDAAVLGNWSVITTLLYYQKTQAQRSDLLIMECISKPRTYDHGVVDNCLGYIERTLGSRPVVIENRYKDLLRIEYRFIPINDYWSVIETAN